MKRLFLFATAVFFLLPLTAHTQDAGESDTVEIFGDTLFLGRILTAPPGGD